ncbi:hypothetical protein JAAARDRAFT_434552 [Jaapia argillacea MUCL 33604]|uniref:G domain-containing protein n=1 Tax=Jaapia argillacea MUCL 33604 TaxID=933084 RepID=A0A067PQ49_9AGAM|nr:hypothetical protein JAAARDRAFT_434552 [Jaapia argillacea MUCL 33604]
MLRKRWPKGGDSAKPRPCKASSRAHLDDIDDFSTEDIVIAVMGPTGSGKSTFVNHITGEEAKVGHSFHSCTSEVQIYKLQSPNGTYDLVFVDTPGFDDTQKSDTVILTLISDWLNKTYKNKILLSGIIYFHRISDNRMAGTTLKNLGLFQKLCGENTLENVILTTTMWDKVDELTASSREEVLVSTQWRYMLSKKSRTSRFLNTRESAWAVIDPILLSAHQKRALLLQTEMGELQRTLPETSAGYALFNNMNELLKKQQHVLRMLRRCREEMIKSTDSDALETLTAEYNRLRQEVGGTMEELEALRVPFGKRLLLKLRRFGP